MTTSIINLSSYTNGLLTDLTTIELQDLTATYGVRRTDDQAVVVASGVDLTRLAVGTYQHTFTDPAANLTYEYTLRIVTGGVTYYYNRIFAAGTVNHIYTIPVTNTHYSSQAEVMRQLGGFAVDLMMEDWESADTSPVWDDILEEVDETINLYISHKYPSNSFDCTFLRRKATKLACRLLSGRRGNPSLYVMECNQVMDELQDIRSGRLHIPQLVPIGNTGPIVQNYIATRDPYRTQRVQQFKSMGAGYPGRAVSIDPYMYIY